MFISLKGIIVAEIDHATELFRMEKNEGQWTCKVYGKASNKKANIHIFLNIAVMNQYLNHSFTQHSFHIILRISCCSLHVSNPPYSFRNIYLS